MNIARPPNGFRVTESAAVAALIQANCENWPRLSVHWLGVKLRLKFTGHREGAPVGNHRPGWRLFVDDGDALAGLPRIKVVYRALGDELAIAMATVG
jgi:hypothetical protein